MLFALKPDFWHVALMNRLLVNRLISFLSPSTQPRPEYNSDSSLSQMCLISSNASNIVQSQPLVTRTRPLPSGDRNDDCQQRHKDLDDIDTAKTTTIKLTPIRYPQIVQTSRSAWIYLNGGADSRVTFVSNASTSILHTLPSPPDRDPLSDIHPLHLTPDHPLDKTRLLECIHSAISLFHFSPFAKNHVSLSCFMGNMSSFHLLSLK